MINHRASIVIPAFNCEKYITKAIESCLNQTYGDTEVIVVDDGSTDNTAQIISDYSGQVRILTRQNGGPGAALNTGMQASTGEYLCFIGADDVLNPDSVQKRVNFLQSNPDIDFVMGDWIEIDENGAVMCSVSVPNFTTSTALRAVFEKNPVNSATILFRRKCFETAGWWNANLRADNDGDLLLRFLIAGLKPCWMNVPLVHYRVHSENITRNKTLMISSIEKCRGRFIRMISTRNLAVTEDTDRQLSKISRVMFDQYYFNAARQVLARSEALHDWNLRSALMVLSFRPIYQFVLRFFIPFTAFRRGGGRLPSDVRRETARSHEPLVRKTILNVA